MHKHTIATKKDVKEYAKGMNLEPEIVEGLPDGSVFSQPKTYIYFESDDFGGLHSCSSRTKEGLLKNYNESFRDYLVEKIEEKQNEINKQ